MSDTSVPLPGMSSSWVKALDPPSTGAALVTVSGMDSASASCPPLAVPPPSFTLKLKVPVPRAPACKRIPCSSASV